MERNTVLKAAALGIAAVSLVFILSSGALGEDGADGPPFRPSEVVVAGSPSTIPQGLSVIKYLPRANLTVVYAPPGSERGLIASLKAQGRRAGLNLIAAMSAAPNDPFYGLQWNFAQIQAEKAWDMTNGAGVTVAVLDTGLKTGGPDGIACVAPGGIDIAYSDSDPDDADGHGTHVAGTIAQAANNGTGVAGLAYGACILPVKVLDDTGSGTFADIAEGVYYAVDHGAKVINMSLGTNARYAVTTDPVMDPALAYAELKGVTVVAAAGNDGNRKNVSYPAIYPTVIAVGATDYAGAVTRYSNRGKGLDLVAPGGNTSVDQNVDGYVDGILQETFLSGSWGYWFFQGTSMATPHVSAAAALLISAGKAATPAGVTAALTTSALDKGEAGYDTTYGYGILQVYNALTGGGTPPPPPPGVDADADGWTVEGGDCNDADPTVYPGHNDTQGKWGRNGVDNDCNGIIDG